MGEAESLNISLGLSKFPTFRREEAPNDILFKASYNHEGGHTCDKCNTDEQEVRKPRESGDVAVHYGTIASGNRMMKSAEERDRVSAELGGVLCFEMEAAGLMNSFPCLVIRGISDYADSHRNKKWQPYAAATAAACAKEILSMIPSVDAAKVAAAYAKEELLTVMPPADVVRTQTEGVTEEAVEFQSSSIVKDGLDDDDTGSFRDSGYGTLSETASVQAAISLPGVREEMLEILVKDDSLQLSGRIAIEVLH